MIKSFRLRIFFTATAIVALVVSLVLWTSWFQILAFEVAKLDVGLCSESRRLAIENFPTEELARLESDIALKLRLNSSAEVRIEVHRDGEDRFLNSGSVARQNLSRDLNWKGSGDDCQLASFQMQGEDWRAARVTRAGVEGVVAADLLAPTQEIRSSVLRALLPLLPLALVLTAAGAWLIAALMMKPITRLREAMKSLTTQKFEKRLSTAYEDIEFVELIQSYNIMLERLQRSFDQATRFSADAAHELRTPLTILRGQIEELIRTAESAELQERLALLLDEVSRLAVITRKLLLLSQADAGLIELTREAVDISGLLNGLCVDSGMLSEDRTVVAGIESGLATSGDMDLLRQLFNNIISNAVRHSIPDSEIQVTAWRGSGHIYARFVNACQPVSSEERLHLFDRFFRGDASRNRRLEGSGLGLSLALEIARAHGGAIEMQESSADVMDVLISLPAL